MSLSPQTSEARNNTSDNESKQSAPFTKPAPTRGKRDFYFSVWRWHFYAGLFVVPFAIILTITGLIMLYHPTLEANLHPEKIYSQPESTLVAYETQAQNVLNAYAGKIAKFMPPKASNLSSIFHVKTDSGQNLKVYVNPYTGQVLGDLSNDNLYALANNIHGTLLIGDLGDWLMELAASFMILLTITGLYLWWPSIEKGNSKWQAFKTALTLRSKEGSRVLWRDLHAIVGVFMVVFILGFCFSGLAWSGVWGGKLTQAWSTFPVDTWGNGYYKSDTNLAALYDQPNQPTHASLNNGPVEEVSWNLEQAPMPVSGTDYGVDGIPAGFPVNLDSVTRLANSLGFTTYRVSLPKGETGVYTISANTMSGDIKDASQDRTMHIDQYTGKILADFGYQDYNLAAKSMAYGVALHSGYMDTWNIVLNTVLCLLILLICISGIVMWWQRRPSKALTLKAPPMPKNLSRWKQASVLMLVLSVFMPLASLCIIGLLCLDALSARYLPRLKQAYQ
ncbi:PepSY domain-containing protein [Marinomonas agarivorans]|nr:PepSY domain-containing protein [Marinomonas agarivorans]